MKKWDPNYYRRGGPSYWGGAKKACDDIGMSLPDKSKLQSIYQAAKKDSSLGFSNSGFGLFWSSSSEGYVDATGTEYMAYTVAFRKSGSVELNSKSMSIANVLCVGDI